ncbi:MAG: hypothetical protein ACOX6E_10405 [Syntrophomonadaceae bacterium]|jgi:hypothetical protein
MKPYLIDVPVRLNVFVRPESLKQVFDVIREARPSILFLVSDGPRDDVPTDRERIEASRRVVENIDWDCSVHRLYSEINQGMYTTGRNASKYIWSKVDRCIFLEDDVVPSVSFFRFCAELLEKYKDDLRISRICGMNHLGIYDEPNSDYFFSREGSIWGTATWKRSHDIRDYTFSYGKDKYIIERLKENTKHEKNMMRKYIGYAKGELVDGHTAGGEFFWECAVDLHNQLNIVATRNMICNIGVGDGSVHSADSLKELPRGIRQVFFMKTYEYDFPLKHPQFVIEDRNYEKKVNRIMGWGHPWVKFYRRIESIIRKFMFGDKVKFIKKVKQKIHGEKQIER